jgi:hypothetical protein
MKISNFIQSPKVDDSECPRYENFYLETYGKSFSYFYDIPSESIIIEWPMSSQVQGYNAQIKVKILQNGYTEFLRIYSNPTESWDIFFNNGLFFDPEMCSTTCFNNVD